MGKKKVSIVLVVWISLVILILTGCASKQKEAVFPDNRPSMDSVYEQHSSEQQVETLIKEARKNPAREMKQSGNYSRSAENELGGLFPVLDNPKLLMYVKPHLSSTGAVGVPGYATTFKMYEKDHYALPGEKIEK